MCCSEDPGRRGVPTKYAQDLWSEVVPSGLGTDGRVESNQMQVNSESTKNKSKKSSIWAGVSELTGTLRGRTRRCLCLLLGSVVFMMLTTVYERDLPVIHPQDQLWVKHQCFQNLSPGLRTSPYQLVLPRGGKK